jgi:hypothetical protein
MSGAGSSPGWLKLRIAMAQATFLLRFQNNRLYGSLSSWRMKKIPMQFTILANGKKGDRNPFH